MRLVAMRYPPVRRPIPPFSSTLYPFPFPPLRLTQPEPNLTPLSNSTPTLTLTGRLASPIPPTTPLKFFAYAWETDVVYWIHGDTDFCAMLLPGAGASVCPLPANEDVKVQFRLPGIAWGYNVSFAFVSLSVCCGVEGDYEGEGKGKRGKGNKS
jgi:hypothetical protein